MENDRLIIMQYFCGLECGEVGSGLNVNLTFLLMTNTLIHALFRCNYCSALFVVTTRVDNYRFVLQIKFSKDCIL